MGNKVHSYPYNHIHLSLPTVLYMAHSASHAPPVHLTESPTTHSIQAKIAPESPPDSNSEMKLEHNGSSSGAGSVRSTDPNNANDPKKKRTGPKRKKVTHGKLIVYTVPVP